MANEKRKCKACGLQFYTTDPTKELCHCCEEALKRLNGYAVPVVRCKDCLWFDTEDELPNVFRKERHCFCTEENGYVSENHFCSYGERREGE